MTLTYDETWTDKDGQEQSISCELEFEQIRQHHPYGGGTATETLTVFTEGSERVLVEGCEVSTDELAKEFPGFDVDFFIETAINQAQ